MQHVQHAGALAGGLRTQPREQPVEPIGVGELGAVGVVALDDGGQQLVEVAADHLPAGAALVPERHQ